MYLIIIVWDQIDQRTTVVIFTIFMTMSPFFVDNFPNLSSAESWGN